MPPTVPVLGKPCYTVVWFQLLVDDKKRSIRPFVVQLNISIHMCKGVTAKKSISNEKFSIANDRLITDWFLPDMVQPWWTTPSSTSLRSVSLSSPSLDLLVKSPRCTMTSSLPSGVSRLVLSLWLHLPSRLCTQHILIFTTVAQMYWSDLRLRWGALPLLRVTSLFLLFVGVLSSFRPVFDYLTGLASEFLQEHTLSRPICIPVSLSNVSPV